jgi:hypothetical protein
VKEKDVVDKKLDEPEHRDPDPDVDVRGVVRAAVALAVGLVAVLGAAAWFTGWLREDVSSGGQTPAPMATLLPHVPPEPRLQPDERAQLRVLRAYEKEQLDSYGWVKKSSGIVHIPIERAMALTVERGLPTRDGGVSDDGPEVAMPTESSLDRRSGGEP